jgi:hypothetical protein
MPYKSQLSNFFLSFRTSSFLQSSFGARFMLVTVWFGELFEYFLSQWSDVIFSSFHLSFPSYLVHCRLLYLSFPPRHSSERVGIPVGFASRTRQRFSSLTVFAAFFSFSRRIDPLLSSDSKQRPLLGNSRNMQQ